MENHKLLLYYDPDITVSMEWYPMLDAWGIHTEVRNFSKDKLRHWRVLFAEFLEHMAQKGITRFIAVPPSEKEAKWQRLFGFKDSGLTLVDWKVMELNYGD